MKNRDEEFARADELQARQIESALGVPKGSTTLTHADRVSNGVLENAANGTRFSPDAPFPLK